MSNEEKLQEAIARCYATVGRTYNPPMTSGQMKQRADRRLDMAKSARMAGLETAPEYAPLTPREVYAAYGDPDAEYIPFDKEAYDEFRNEN
jgi:hypothetical protein